jgi:quercetin dioxygenase-like cupin family protein
MDSLTGAVFIAVIANRALIKEPTMITPGQTLENRVTGERFTFTETAATTDGELLAFDLSLRAGGAVPIPHQHPAQTERFEVVSGRMRFRIGLRHVVAGPGDVVEVEPGVVHGFANAGNQEALVAVEVRPALEMEEMLAEVVEIAEAGRMSRRGLPRNPIEFASLARRYDRVAHAPWLNVHIQRFLLAPLVALARTRRAPRIATEVAEPCPIS